jgi:hypothetical protein
MAVLTRSHGSRLLRRIPAPSTSAVGRRPAGPLLPLRHDLHHLRFLAVRPRPVHLVLEVVVVHPGDDLLHRGLLAGHRIPYVAVVCADLAGVVTGSGLVHDAGPHVVHPGADVLLADVVVAVGPAPLEGHPHEIPLPGVLDVAAAHQDLRVHGAGGLHRRLAGGHPGAVGERPVAGHAGQPFLMLSGGHGLHHGLHLGVAHRGSLLRLVLGEGGYRREGEQGQRDSERPCLHDVSSFEILDVDGRKQRNGRLGNRIGDPAPLELRCVTA